MLEEEENIYMDFGISSILSARYHDYKYFLIL